MEEAKIIWAKKPYMGIVSFGRASLALESWFRYGRENTALLNQRLFLYEFQGYQKGRGLRLGLFSSFSSQRRT
jgi:hypothetical protein